MAVITQPVLRVEEVIRNISVGAMQRRFTMFEEALILGGSDTMATVIRSRLMNADYCALDFEDTQTGVAYLVNFFVNNGLVEVENASARIDTILEDGKEDEKYRGEL